MAFLYEQLETADKPLRCRGLRTRIDVILGASTGPEMANCSRALDKRRTQPDPSSASTSRRTSRSAPEYHQGTSCGGGPGKPMRGVASSRRPAFTSPCHAFHASTVLSLRSCALCFRSTVVSLSRPTRRRSRTAFVFCLAACIDVAGVAGGGLVAAACATVDTSAGISGAPDAHTLVRGGGVALLKDALPPRGCGWPPCGS